MKFQKEKVLNNYIVLARKDKIVYAAKGYQIYISENDGKNWELDGKIKDIKYGTVANLNRLVARLLRAEITSLIVLEDGTRIAVGKKAIFRAKVGEKIYRKTFSILRGTRPLNICVDGKGILYFGEYLSNKKRDSVSIYRSSNNGEDWEICYTFPANTIRHIHGIHYDKYEDKLWFTTGDLDGECIIGYSDNNFYDIKIFKQGGQLYRAVDLMFFKDFILYGTDTETAKNYICKIDRTKKNIECLQKIQGSVLSAFSNGQYAVLSTAVEPSEVNKDLQAHVWFSHNGKDWIEIFQADKDSMSAHYFQFGRFKFPKFAIENNRIYLTGHALKDIDGSTLILKMNKGDKD